MVPTRTTGDRSFAALQAIDRKNSRRRRAVLNLKYGHYWRATLFYGNLFKSSSRPRKGFCPRIRNINRNHINVAGRGECEQSYRTKGRKANLSGAEKKAIDALAAKYYSTRPIAKSTDRGESSVACYLRNEQVVSVNDHLG